MGTKVRFDNHYSMLDLNHDPNAANWPLYCGENNLPMGQYYYNPLPRPAPDSFLGVDKDLLKQKMLEHEAMFKNQVFELHRLYSVQKDLMGEVRKTEQYKHWMPCETSSSSSAFVPKGSHVRNSSSFLFPSSACGGPPVSDPESIGSSTGGPLKGKSVQGNPILLYNCASPKNSEVSKRRPAKLRKTIDLQLPADEYDDIDEVEQLASDIGLRKPNAIADLNEPLECEDAFASPSLNFGVSEDFSWKSKLGNMNGAQNNSHFTDKGNGQNWISSMLKSEGTKDNVKSIHQTNNSEISHHVKEDLWPAKADHSSIIFEKSRPLSSFDYPGMPTASHPPYALPSSYKGDEPTSVQKAPFFCPASFDLNRVVPTDSSDDVKREDPASVLPWLRKTDSGKKKVLFDMNMPCDDDPEEFDNAAPTSEAASLEKMEAARPNGFRPLIDLNSCLMEDEIPSFAEGMKNRERGFIDLEAPIDLEAEDEELAMVAAEAIVAISSSLPDSQVENRSEDALRWFAGLVCSNLDDPADSVSCESDYFEEMTLKLTECTVEEYFPSPPGFDIPMEVTGSGRASVTGRPRRGPTRRGRQRRDFQRDILPGLTSLARHEVSKDLQTFGGLMKATGHAWQCGSGRNSSRGGSRRGRRRAVLEISPPPPVNSASFAVPNKVPESEVIVVEGRSLTSWGKTTRRPRRQRCPTGAGKGELLPV